jgi:dTDP-glucose 4,6-dehydratase
MIFVTGGAGFIGANFVLNWLAQSDESVLNFDKLTYAGNLNTLKSLQNDPRHLFSKAIFCDTALLDEPVCQTSATSDCALCCRKPR